MPADLADMLKPDCIELELEGRKKPEILRELLGVVTRCAPDLDVESLYDSLIRREELSTTGIGDGIAIPHCLTPQVKGTLITFGRKLDGARFGAVDNKPVSLFFLLVGPESNPALHLQVLSKLARYLHDPNFCGRLLDAESEQDVIEAFRSKDRL